MHGSDIHHRGRRLPFAPGFSAGKGRPCAGLTASEDRERSLRQPGVRRPGGAAKYPRTPGAPERASLGIAESELRHFIPVRNRQTTEPTALAARRGNRRYPEETGGRENGSRTSRLHKHEAFPFARLGFLRFLFFILHSLFFQSPYGLAPSYNWHLRLASSSHLSRCCQQWLTQHVLV